MLIENNPVHVERFALIPIGIGKQRDDGHDGCLFIRRAFHTDACVMRHREEVIDHIEPAGAGRIIHTAKVNQLIEFTDRIVAQKRNDVEDIRTAHF